MKTWKHLTFAAILAVFGIIGTFIACDNGNNKIDPKCDCPNGTVHTDAKCDCDAFEYDCTCTYEPPIITTDPECDCPNGMVHTDDECSCEAVGYDCTCTYNPPVDHTGTIEAFDQTINVVGDKSISTADFYIALGKVEEVITVIEKSISENTVLTKAFTTMVTREGFVIIIKTGNAGPDADANKFMTIGIDYLLENDDTTIGTDIMSKVATEGAFVE